MQGGFCSQAELGQFILDLPEGKTQNETSFWSARVAFPAKGRTIQASGFWNSPDGNPTPPPGNYTTPWRRTAGSLPNVVRSALNPSPTGILTYNEPIQYLVRKTGYYCVGK